MHVHMHTRTVESRERERMNKLQPRLVRRPCSSLAADAPTTTVHGADVVPHSPAYYHRLLRSAAASLPTILQLHARLLVLNLHHNVVLSNSLVRAYAAAGQHRRALAVYRSMVEAHGVVPDKYTFTFALKACAGAMDREECDSVHRRVLGAGLVSDVYVATGLVDAYCKLGMVGIARELFEEMPRKDVVAWNAVIAGASRFCEPGEALGLFGRMQAAGVMPNHVSLLSLFPAVCKVFDGLPCRAVHGFVVRRPVFPRAVFNGLVDAYLKCGDVEVARRVFDVMSEKDEVSWGTMVSGYVQNQCHVEALELFDDLRRKNLMVNSVAVVAALSAAAETKDLARGVGIHAYMIERKVRMDASVVTALFTMYAKCGELDEAKKLFAGMEERDTVAWSAMISVLVQAGRPEEAVFLFQEMLMVTNVKPNRVTMAVVLPACGELSALLWGKSLHCYAVKFNMSSNLSTQTALISMYMKCTWFPAAHTLFDNIAHKDVVTWNAVINGYAQVGDAKMTLKLFFELQLAGIQPDSGTMVGVLPACVLLEALHLGMSFHGYITKCGHESDPHVKNALIDMYVKCGNLCLAEILFNANDFVKDEITWNIMIAGCTQNGQAREAILYFKRMKAENVKPNLVTFVSVLPATSYLASVREGMVLHSYIIRVGLESSLLVGNSLIDMYSKCGRLDLAQALFNRMESKDIVSWNVMLSAHATHGLGGEAIELFTKMGKNSVEPDAISFLNILSACRHEGLVEEGINIFESMNSLDHVEPNLEHYACMVDLLGRAGNLDKAWSLISQMPMTPDAAVWGALLGACRMHSNVKLGEIALDNLTRLEPQNPAHYVVLSNIYAQSGRWMDAGKMRTALTSVGLMKTPGCSWVEIKGELHAFKVGDTSHPQFEQICGFWKDLNEKLEKAGFLPDTSPVLQNVEEEEKQSFLYGHSERLATAFAILNTKPSTTVQIVKNLRVCSDCHTVTKLVSEITHRKIVVRDASRFHIFQEGSCSCKNYW